MAAFLVATLGLLFFAQSGLSRPEGDAGPNFEQLLKELRTSVDKTFDEVKKNLNLPENPDGASIVKAIKEQSTQAEKAFGDMKKKLEESVKKNPEIQGAIDALKSKLDEASAKLKKENPEVHANAQKAADTLKGAYDSVGKELEKIHSEVNKKGGLRDDFESLFKNLVDRGSAAVKELEKNVKQAVEKASQKS